MPNVKYDGDVTTFLALNPVHITQNHMTRVIIVPLQDLTLLDWPGESENGDFTPKTVTLSWACVCGKSVINVAYSFIQR